MATIDVLALGTSLDLGGLDRDLQAASDKVDAYFGTAGKKLLDMPTGAARVELPDAAKGLGQMGDLVAASLVTLGPRIQASLQSALAPLSSKIGVIAATISRQLNDSFNFAKVRDGIQSTTALFEHDLGIMRRSLDAFGRAGTAGATAPFKAMQATIKDAEFQLGKFLQHASASFKKGGFPTLDTFFSKQSRTYRAGKGSDASGGLASQGPAFDRATKSMGLIRAATDRAKFSMIGFGAEVAAALGFFALGYKAVNFLKAGVKGASDLNETLSKTDVILGSASGQVKQFAEDMATRFGLVKGTTLDTAASLGGLGKALGNLRGDQLAQFSTRFTKLAADVSSIQNIDLSTAADAIRIGLSGNQSDKLKELGVITTEVATKQYALAHGIGRVGKELSEQQKFMARAGLIAEGLAFANGDLERTLGGVANQGRKLSGTLSNLATSIGQALLPAVNAGVVYLNEFATYAYKAFEDNRATIEGWANAVVDSFDVFASVVTHLPDAFEVARLMAVEKLLQIGDVLATLGPNAAIVAEYIANNWTKLITDAFNATLTGLQNLWKNWQAVGTAIGEWFADPTQGFNINWTPLLDGFKATAEKFPDLIRPTLTDMSKEIADASRPITDDLSARRARRAQEKLQQAGLAPDVPPKADVAAKGEKTKPFEFAAAAEVGTKEGYTGIINALTNRGSEMTNVAKASKKTADNTGQIANEMKGLRKDLGNKPPMMVF